MTQAEKKAKAIELRKQGLLLREIAAEVGVPRSTVFQWIDDPDMAKATERRKRYEGTCDTCGGPTDGSGGFKRVVTRCQTCREWTPEAVVLAFKEWGDDHGGVPPRQVDALRGADHGRLPSQASVTRLFGSWNGGLLAADYVPRMDKRPETSDAMAEMIRGGASTAEVADRFGCSEPNVHHRVRHRTGKSVRELRQEAA